MRITGVTTGDEKAEASKVEYALFLVNGEMTFLLHAVGLAIEGDLDAGLERNGEAGPWSEIPKEEGLWIWEGTPGWTNPYNAEGINEGSEPIYEKRGAARRPAEAEVKVLVNGPICDLFGPSRWDAMIEASDAAERAP